MTGDRERHHRRSIRLQGYDYSQTGAYFVTVCVKDRVCLFGQIVDGEMVLNMVGNIVDECWRAIPVHFEHTALDVFVVMPNHIHGIIWMTDTVGARHAVPLRQPSEKIERFGQPIPDSLPTVVRSFKSAATKRINEIRDVRESPIWQRNYYEHVIRNQRALDAIRCYIQGNPGMWAHDLENPRSRRNLRLGRDAGYEGGCMDFRDKLLPKLLSGELSAKTLHNCNHEND